MTTTLTAQPREVTGKASRRLLDEGRMPAVVYGPKQEATSVSLSLHEFKKVLRDAGESTVIALEGVGKDLQVLIHAIDMDPVTNTPRHADFYAIEKGAKVEVAVPLTYVGESPAVKLGANLVKVMHELTVEADPSKLPHEIEVDISALAEVGNQIHVKDIKVPSGVEVKEDADEVVALIQEVEVEAEEEAAPVDMDAIEVEAKGKGEDEEAAS
jgi:large subunit ribosomal protein L25